MIFTGEHWTYGVVQAAVIVVEILLLRFVAGRNRVLDRFVVWAIAVFLVLYKLDEYGFGKSVPLDLSVMSYFLFGLAAVVPFRPLKCAASFSAMLSGAIYALTMLLFPENHFSEVTSVTQDVFLIRMAMLNHNLLFVGGGFMCSFARFGREDFVWLFGWYGFFMAYLKLMVDGFGVSTKYVSIIRIMDGSLVADVLGVSAALSTVGASVAIRSCRRRSRRRVITCEYGVRQNREKHAKKPRSVVKSFDRGDNICYI